MTLDGFCDHTAGIPDEELHKHYSDLLDNSGVILYGWRQRVSNNVYWGFELNNY